MDVTIVTNDGLLDVHDTEETMVPYKKIRVQDDLWEARLQDLGCRKEYVVKKTYRMNSVMSFGPKEEVLYYEQLSASVIDLVKAINTEKKEGRGWKRFPRNATDVKASILKIIMNLRKFDEDNNKYDLDQNRVLGLLETQYGLGVSAQTVEENDKLRIYGLLFIPSNYHKLSRLGRGVEDRQDLDDPERSIKGIFESISLEFNNENITIELPSKAEDIEGIENETLDPNDATRIRIKRDGKWCNKVYRKVLTEYKAMLYKWYKGTGGGSGDKTMFQDWSEEKLDKYDVIAEEYDHSNVKDRPSVLIDNYSKTKYLTIIFLWDEEKDYILGSKYNPFSIGIGEAGINDKDDSTVSQITLRSTPDKPKAKFSAAEEATALVASVFSLVNDKKETSKDDMMGIEDQSLAELMQLHEMYLSNFNFKKDNGMLTDDTKVSMMQKMDCIFEIIEARSSGKKRSIDDIDNNSNNVS